MAIVAGESSATLVNDSALGGKASAAVAQYVYEPSEPMTVLPSLAVS